MVEASYAIFWLEFWQQFSQLCRQSIVVTGIIGNKSKQLKARVINDTTGTTMYIPYVQSHSP